METFGAHVRVMTLLPGVAGAAAAWARGFLPTLPACLEVTGPAGEPGRRRLRGDSVTS